MKTNPDKDESSYPSKWWKSSSQALKKSRPVLYPNQELKRNLKSMYMFYIPEIKATPDSTLLRCMQLKLTRV